MQYVIITLVLIIILLILQLRMQWGQNVEQNKKRISQLKEQLEYMENRIQTLETIAVEEDEEKKDSVE